MILIVAGSRSITNYKIVKYCIQTLYDVSDISEIVSGTATGVDSLGEQFADEYNIPVKKFPADWTKYGKSAGYIRNKHMADYGEELLLLWDGQSKGSINMMENMRRVDKPFKLVNLERVLK